MTLWKAAALGAVVGSRTLLVPALISRTTRQRRLLPLLAAMEIAADKTPWIPARTAPVSLAGRMLVAAAVAFRLASSTRGWRMRPPLVASLRSALVAAASAGASAFLLHALRSSAAVRSSTSNVLGGLCEDLLAFGVGRALTRT